MLLVVIMIGGAAPLGALVDMEWATVSNNSVYAIHFAASWLGNALRGLSLRANAAEYSGECGDNVTWSLDKETGILTISGTGAMTDYNVWNCPWYYNRSSIQTIIIENGITHIGKYVFYECSKLKSVTIPIGVLSIGESAFCECSNLTCVTMPDSVETIGDSAFSWCSSLTNVNLSKRLKTIGASAFYFCVSLSDIVIPDSVTSIGASAFYVCKNITDVVIPDNVTSIGSSAFRGCESLEKITLPFVGLSMDATGKDTVFGAIFGYTSSSSASDVVLQRSSSSYAYYYIPLSLRSVTLTNCPSVPYGAFENCSMLTELTIPECVTRICDNALRGCTSILSITFNAKKCMTVGSPYFSDCTSLQNLVIGENVQLIPENFMYNCSSITEIVIPDSVTDIGKYAFYNCTSLVSVTISKSIASIRESVFYNCIGITNFVVPDNITDIGQNAFYNCSRLAQIKLSANLRHIGENAFFGTALYTDANNWTDGVLYIDNSLITTDRILSGTYAVREGTVCLADAALKGCGNLVVLEIPASVLGIGTGMFDSCYGLTEIRVATESPTYCTDNLGVLYDREKKVLIHCPASSSIDNYTVPEGVLLVDDGAFTGCKSLVTIDLPDSVTEIGSNAFNHCSALSTVRFPKALSIIGDYGFSNCGSLSSVELPDCVAEIGERAFFNCSRVRFIQVPKNVKVIRSYSFAYCGLKYITLGENVTSVEADAFTGNSLRNISFGPSVQKYDVGFSEYSALRSVCYSGTVEQWLSTDFSGYYVSILTSAPRYYHTHNDTMPTEVRDAVDATCYYDGYSGDTNYLPCGALKEKGETIPATGHDWDEGAVTREPTCTWEGITTFTCKNDSYHTRTETIPALGHDYVTTETPATCTQSGQITVVCSRCETHEWSAESRISPLGHDWDDGVVTREATCTENGVITFTCRHDASHTREEYTPALWHDWNDGVVTREPTCTQNGIITFICKRDASHTREEYTPAKGHIFGAWQQTKAPTAEAEGKAQRRCSVCGDVETITLAKLPAPEKLTLSKTSVTLNYKDSETLTASEAVTWTSSNEKIVKVDAVTGKLTTVGKGTATVTAHSVQGDKTATCEVTVKYTFIQILIRIFLLGFIWY